MEDLDLAGCHILLVEDEHMVAKSLARLLDMWKAKIVGPAGSVEGALALLRSTEKIDYGLLDVTLRSGTVFQVADALSARSVPFAFTTGSSTSVIPEGYRHAAVLQKPYDPVDLAKALPMTCASRAS